ncbi:plastocyanin/azurin family copper-binding protein [Marinicella sp. W31]|uniref:plastocyanin/azurin family copper-binding protein n=1 Tax=Marinicella sp. W31 TaxID=3023713 RepID=UPI0037566AD6
MQKITVHLLMLSVFFFGLVQAEVHEVLVSSNNFSPSALTIEAGDTVRWINTGGSHNVVARDNSFRCAEGCDGQGGNGNASASAWQVEVTFRQTGTINYFCEPHDVFGMRGSITVVEPTEPAPQIQALPNNSFSPDELTVIAGEKLRITNVAGVHNFRTNNDDFICSEACVGDNQLLETGPIGFPWDIYISFDTPGQVPYYCETHQADGMLGIINVLSDNIFANGFEP